MVSLNTSYFAALRAANGDVAPIPGIDSPVGYVAGATPLRSAATLNAADGVYVNKALNTVVIYKSGTTFDHVDFRGMTVFVQANDVTLKNSLFDARTGTAAVVGYPGYSGLTIDRSTFDGLKLNKYYLDFVLAQGTNTTITNNAFLNAPSDAIYIESGRVAGNYIAGGGYQVGAHADAIWIGKTTGPVTIEHNLVDWRNAPDAKAETNNAIRITAEKGDASNITVQKNVLLGGSYTVSVTDTANDAGDVSDVTVKHNVVDEGQYGALYFSDRPGDLVYTENHGKKGQGQAGGAGSTGTTLADLVSGTKLINGTAQADALVGTAGRDYIVGGGGQDWISAGAGDDVIQGGDGRDYLYGGEGADTFVYTSFSDGRDLISDFVGGTDKIRFVDLPGAPKDASAWTWLGTERFDGNAWELRTETTANGNTMIQLDRDGDMAVDFEVELAGRHTLAVTDFILGIGAVPALSASAAPVDPIIVTALAPAVSVPAPPPLPTTVIRGTEGNDLLIGTSTAELIYGGNGGDSIKAGDGDDVVIGGGGKDIISTGAGRDRIVYETVTDSLPQSRDYILDFTPGEDVIDLSAIDAVSGTAANDAFLWIGTEGFSGRAGELRTSLTAVGSTLIQADINGDRVADFAIELAGNVCLASTDFVL
jgi:serralysin